MNRKDDFLNVLMVAVLVALLVVGLQCEGGVLL